MEYDDRWKQKQERWAAKQRRWEERWARKQERWANRQRDWGNRPHYWQGAGPTHGIIVSVGIIALGALFLMDNLGIVRFHDVARFWPAILIALGVVRMVDSHGSASLTWGAILAGIGGLLLLDNLNLIYFDWRIVWPAILIGIGVLMLLRTTEWSHRGPDQGGAPPPEHPGALNLFAMFGGGDRLIDAQDFRGGQVSVMFGGFEIDLRSCKMAEGQATIDISAMFGGVEIQIPETWQAEVKGTALFGGFSNDTRPPSADQAPPPRLIVTGYAMFGGVTITN